MAHRLSPNSLIHCNQCGEDYSVTYKRCPFCGARNTPPAAPDEPEPRPASSRTKAPADPDDTYVFDGQDLFDDREEDGQTSAPSRGGKRLADSKPLPNPFANADINWPRVITFVCSLVIIVAAMVVVFTVVYPQLRGNDGPVADGGQSPSPAASDPAGGATQSAGPDTTQSAGPDTTQSAGPDTTDPVSGTTDPVTEPTATVPPTTVPTATVPPTASGGLNSFTTNTYGEDTAGFSLQQGESFQMRLTFNPASWSGTVTYSVSDTSCATVSADGKVVNVNQESATRRVTLTITAGGITLEMPVYCVGTGTGTTATPEPTATPTPSGSGGSTTGRQATVVNATGGLNVRSGPGVSYRRFDSLWNGDTVTVVEDAGNGWYKISYIDTAGEPTQGYVMGTYLSIN